MSFRLIGLIVTMLAGGLIAYFMFNSGRPKRELNAVMAELSLRTTKQFAVKLPRIQNMEDVLVVPVVGGRDEDQQLKEIILSEISKSHKYSVKTWDKIREDLEDNGFWSQFVKKIGLVGKNPPKTLLQASEASKQLKRANYRIDGILIVKALFDQGNGDGLNAKVRLEGHFFDPENTGTEREVVKEVEVIGPSGKKTNKTQIFKELDNPLKNYDTVAEMKIDSIWNRLYLTYKIDNMNFFARLLLWLASVAFMPWACINLVRAMLRKRDNTMNIIVLAVFTFLNVFGAWVALLAVTNVGLGGVMFLLFTAGICGYYNYDAVEYIDRKLL